MECVEMEVVKQTVRRMGEYGKRFWVTAESTQRVSEWGNCLYLHLVKEDWPQFKFPVLKKGLTYNGEARFDYWEGDITSLDLHGGCTFYQERIDPTNGLTYVKIGCDYLHLGDEEYRYADRGDDILKYDGARLLRSFENFVLKSSEPETSEPKPE